MSLDNSPFISRLDTNYVPSDSEVLEIRALLLEPVHELARIDARIEEIELALEQLKEQRALLKTPIDAHRALISPIRRIPQDVLIEIFRACLPSEHDALIDFAEAPLLLSRICRHWRNVAYSTPMLWSAIHIPSPDSLDTPSNFLARLEKIVEEWLKRSATCFLSVSLFDPIVRLLPEFDKHPLVLQLLPFSRRLRRLTLTGDADLFRPLLKLGLEDLPHLKSLAMQCHGDGPDFPNAFELPTLEDVTLQMSSTLDPRSLPLHWSQLTTLRLECDPVWTEHGQKGGLDFAGAFNVLRMCPVLVHCDLGITKNSKETLDTSPITLPHLQTFVLRGGLFLFDTWFPFLVVPNLRSLRLGHARHDQGDDPADRLTQEGSMRVTIDTRCITTLGIRDVLRSFPLVSHLRLFHPSGGNVDDEFLESLGSLGTRTLCPMLTDMIILGPSPLSLSDVALLSFIKARMAMRTPLHRIRVQFIRPMELDIMPELGPLISGGLQVDIEYPPPEWEFEPREGLAGSGHRRLRY
ncbi:hypothetical protein C8R45DRAFT_961982 [Mycena sanguinolenta]|nr:hypothetical protein C8R45DRAFT_961982 [Mycena sanguinolenta]